ncbi:putative DNA binding domain-containing protein [Candidatus Berkiella cookevillensis]|uniref:DNA binding domain-containing protein n=1 Tax=Candidatus Berkiella cookevillensis TaxID=437022 RepID=A0A0Q9YKZ5_9GAMM|nr:ATP-binding protein [Candidatus Berkiella cookevillensis]MCS5709279.1 putative DNA binding domain-containing protein [Candidatus Berkiella cookevillensis]
MKPERLVDLLNQLLLGNRESEWLEFKENNSKPEKLGEYISALSNSALLNEQEYGYMVFGVKDNSLEIVGTEFKPKDVKIGNEELENWLARLLNPNTDFKIFEFCYQGKNIALIKIEAAKIQPVAFKNIEYVRVGTYKKKLSDYPEKARKIWGNSVVAAFEERVAKDDVDEDEILGLLDYTKYFELLGIKLPTNKSGIIDKLIEEKFITRKNSSFQITNLGAILFSKNLNQFDGIARKVVRVVLYEGKNRITTRKEHMESKGYAIGFSSLIEYLNDQLPRAEKIGTVFRQDLIDFPEIAIRELVANAVIHQDFSKSGTGPMIEIFSDRVEITNPGKPLIEPQRFMDHSPQSRNEKLAHFMRRIKICEERGSGIDKVISAIEDKQLPGPDFIEEENFLRVILYSHMALSAMGKDDKIRACYQHCCLKHVSNEVMTNESLRQRFNISKQNYSMASRIIADSIKANLIKLQDPDGKSKKLARYIPFWA